MGKSSSGYNDEIWKFDWSTRKYELTASSGIRSGFTKCSITLNSNHDEILEVYLGETDAEAPIPHLYQLNTRSYEKTLIEVPSSYSSFIPRSAAIKLDDEIIIAGGKRLIYTVKSEVFIVDTALQTVKTAYLDSPNYSAASIYYKDKIYIHGGGGSYGALPLEDIIRRDLIVIDLNEDCEYPPYVCISS